MRSPEDGRVCCVKVTPSGRSIIKALSQENENQVSKIMEKIDPAMQEIIKTALWSFVQAIQNKD
jgi:DNA-binding MarR family transcriptional regulator